MPLENAFGTGKRERKDDKLVASVKQRMSKLEA